MGKKVYTVNSRMYIIDDDTGEIQQLLIKEGGTIPQDDFKAIIKILAAEAKKQNGGGAA